MAEAQGMKPALLLALLLGACGTPAVLRGPVGGASMPEPSGVDTPLPRIVEPTGEPRITLPVATQDGFTPPAAPRSDRAARP